MTSSIIACLMLACSAPAQPQSPSNNVEALGLESMKVGRLTTLFAPSDRSRAKQLAELSEAAAVFFERELGVSFEFRLAVLGPNQWFSPHGGPGMPYGIPWGVAGERLMVVPGSLTEGALINGPDALADRRRVDFVRVAEIYAKHGLGFLRALKEKLPFHSMSAWTTESLLADLEHIAPGFQRWADEFQKGGKPPKNNYATHLQR